MGKAASKIWTHFSPDSQFFLTSWYHLTLNKHDNKIQQKKNYQNFSDGVSKLSYVTADSMKSVLFQLHHAVYGMNLKKKEFQTIAFKMTVWYVEFTTSELTVNILLCFALLSFHAFFEFNNLALLS